MSATLLASGWTDGSSVGYPVLFGGVLLGSIVPVVPTGAVVGAAAAFAITAHELNLVAVLVVATLAAWLGDVVTFAVCRFGGPAAVRWVARGQHADRIEEVREQFRLHGWQIVVAGRLLPAGRIPVLLAAGALAYPWRRLLVLVVGAVLNVASSRRRRQPEPEAPPSESGAQPSEPEAQPSEPEAQPDDESSPTPCRPA